MTVTGASSTAGGDVDVPPRLGPGGQNGARPPRRTEGGRVLVLNASYEPLNVCSVRRAVVLILKDKAEMLEQGERTLHAESITLPHPVVIRLVTYVRVPRDRAKRRITRRAVFARDSWTCQYCGTTSHLTVDHVIPRSRGGPSDWENIVTSCAPCNRRKGNRTPVEAGIHPRRKPRAPGPTIFIRVAAPVVPAAWQQYLLA
jgi:5-methylcytosine-specific restriction endonuclease McrA